MSSFTAGQLGGGQFDNLISQLRARNPGASSSGSQFEQQMPVQNAQFYDQATNLPPQQLSYQAPSTPPSQQQQSRRTSNTMNPNDENLAGRVTSQSNADRTASLLNLLKFSGPGSNQSAPISLPQTNSTSTEGRSSFGAAAHQSVDGRNTPGTDLIAALMGNTYAKPAQASPPQNSSRVPSATFRPQASAPPHDTQNFLLQLLNRPKPAQTNALPTQATLSKANTAQSKEVSASDVADLSQALEQSSLENPRRDSGKNPAPVVFGGAAEPTSTPAKNLFTYQNPFEELSRSSPRNRTSKQGTPAESAAPTPLMQILKHPRHNPASEVDGYNREAGERGQSSSPAYTKRKLEISDPSSPIPILPDGRTEIEALMGIGASPKKGKETVSEALTEVGETVNKQVEAALVEAEKGEAQAEIEKGMRELMNAQTDKEFEVSAQMAAQAIKKELDKNGNEHVLEDNMSPTTADAVKEIIDETAQGHIADSWESADAESVKEGGGYVVKVFNFPIRPFAALTVTIPVGDRPAFRTESANPIARLKKDFDQIDRTLVTATDTFMIYCMPKNGGIRIIHQGNGNNSKLFSNHEDRVFNIAATEAGETEAILGTGVSNTVYWAVINEGEYDEEFLPETKSFALPPSQAHDGESPGVLKTRARKSGSHNEFFAVGRGKSIHIIQPAIILQDKKYFLSGEGRIIDTEKYLNDHGMVINTGKAGKDFTFSPDDSVIVSLDKAGKVRIWDVRPFTGKWVSSKTPVTLLNRGEIKEPMMTLVTTLPSEKSWATSVMFVDKSKPFQKGGPLRYLIIGMKQNHTLQLWDIALGRAVQELNLPHEKESDAVCSVLFHPATSIIIVGHPTRNSIYFIHLSAPKYGLSRTQNQAEYIDHLVTRDTSYVVPDSTAVMSGIREFSFSTPDKEIGTLRSLEILQQPTSNNPSNGGAPVLFELYAMHSKGITCIPIKQDDLGWSLDNKVLHAVDAEKAGVIRVDKLKTLSAASTAESVHESTRGSPAASARGSSHRGSVKEASLRDAGKKTSNSERLGLDRNPPSETAVRAATPVIKAAEKSASKTNGSVPEPSAGAEKPPRNRKKKNANSATSPPTSQAAKNETSAMEHPILLTRNGSPSKSQKPSVPMSILSAAAAEAVKPPTQQPSIGLDQRDVGGMMKSFEDSITPEISRVMNGSLQDLYKRLDEDKRVQAAAGDAKHEAVLRLVSKSLEENVTRTIEHAVRNVIEAQVLPAVIGVTSSTLNEQFGGKLAAQINKSVPKELHSILPDAVSKALQKPALLDSVANAVAGAVIGRVESQLAVALEQAIMPSFANLVSRNAQTIVDRAQQHAEAQIQSLTYQHQRDSAQIAQLTQAVEALSNNVSTMAEVQTRLQEQFFKQRPQGNSRRPTPSNSRSVNRSPVQEGPSTPQADEQLDRALRAVQSALQNHQLEAAFVAWLQSDREEQIFRDFFSKIGNLDFINQLSPLVLLSVGAMVTQDLSGFEPLKKLDWLEKILSCFPVQPNYFIPMDDRIREVLPDTMSAIEKKLAEHYNRLNIETRGQNPQLLRRIGVLLQHAQLVRNQYGMPN